VAANRGEVWLTALGLAAKIRPCLDFSIRPMGQDRVLVSLVPHTTAVRGTRFEIPIPKSFLKPGAFNAQGLVTAWPERLIRKFGELTQADMQAVEQAWPSG